MLKITEIEFTLSQIAKNDTSPLLLVGVSPFKEYIEGKASDKVKGFKYECICPKNRYERIFVKVEETQPLFTAEELTGTVKVIPIDFVGKFYRDRNGEYQFTAKATRMEVVD